MIFLLELRAACYALRAVAGRRRGVRIECWVDNLGVYYCLRKMRSQHFVANTLISRLAQRLSDCRCRLQPHWLPSAANIADFWTRAPYQSPAAIRPLLPTNKSVLVDLRRVRQ